MTGHVLFPSGQPDVPSSTPAGPSDETIESPSVLNGPSTTPPSNPWAPLPGPPLDPWRPIVLALDGGGIRGLSSLYIIREIMAEIQKCQLPGSGEVGKLPLPCHYFDFMVGTSTGGLIAIMLGRLRMDIDECIEAYRVFGNSIFRPQTWRILRYISKRFQYSPSKFTAAVETVVRQHCHCNEGPGSTCTDASHHKLRQHDFAEQEDHMIHQPHVNSTCKAAVVTMREGGGNSDGRRAAHVVYLFRTYDHRTRMPHFDQELNPRALDKSTLTIVEACRATSAAPTWFPPVKLRGRRFIDGGVTDYNNPAYLAWNEANEMAHKPGEPVDQIRTKGPCILLSIGTGKTEPPRNFGLCHLFLSAKHRLTDTEATHVNMNSWTKVSACFYRRFSVPESNTSPGIKGLDTVNLDSCKKKRKGPFWARFKPNDARDENAKSEVGPGGYKPWKYRYTTYEKIESRTQNYCGPESLYDNKSPQYETVLSEIKKCARVLFEVSEQRKAQPERWEKFRQHPDLRSRTPPEAATEPATQASMDPESQVEAQEDA